MYVTNNLKLYRNGLVEYIPVVLFSTPNVGLETKLIWPSLFKPELIAAMIILMVVIQIPLVHH